MHHHGDISLFAVDDHKFCTSGLAVPEGQDQVRVFDDGNVPPQRSAPAVLAVLRQELGQLQPMAQGIVSGTGIHATSPARYDLGHAFREIVLQMVHLEPS